MFSLAMCGEISIKISVKESGLTDFFRFPGVLTMSASQTGRVGNKQSVGRLQKKPLPDE